MTFRNRAIAFFLAVFALLACPMARADDDLEDFLEKVSPAEVVPGADRFGKVQEHPEVAPAYHGDKLLGHVVSDLGVRRHEGLFGQADPHRRRARPRGHDRRRQARRAQRADRADRHPGGEGRHLPQVLRRLQPAEGGGRRPGAAAPGHRQRRDGHRAGDGRKRGALGGARGARAAVGRRSGRRGAGRGARRRSAGGCARRLGRLAEGGRGAPPASRGRPGEQGLRRFRQHRRRAASGARPRGRGLHRPLCGARLAAGDRPQPARRGRIRERQADARAGPGRHPRRRRRHLFVQGFGLCARRHLRPHRADPGRRDDPLPRPAASPRRQPARRRRAGAEGDRRLPRPAGQRIRPGRAVAAAAARAARNGRARARPSSRSSCPTSCRRATPRLVAAPASAAAARRAAAGAGAGERGGVRRAGRDAAVAAHLAQQAGRGRRARRDAGRADLDLLLPGLSSCRARSCSTASASASSP